MPRLKPIWCQLSLLLGGAGIVGAAALESPIRPVIFIGDSMAPTYHSFELAITEPPKGPLRHGDIVVIQMPTATIIKRVAYLAGEVYAKRFVQGNVTGLILPDVSTRRTKNKLSLLRVPPDHVFVLGDNRAGSQDSRVYGPIPVSWIRRLVIAPRMLDRSGREALEASPESGVVRPANVATH